eukprot:5591951-Amphidinium_carterae.1
MQARQLAQTVARVGHVVVKVRAHMVEPPHTSTQWLAWRGNHMADVTAGDMLKVDGGSYRRAEATKQKAVALQRLAQHVGFTA